MCHGGGVAAAGGGFWGRLTEKSSRHVGTLERTCLFAIEVEGGGRTQPHTPRRDWSPPRKSGPAARRVDAEVRGGRQARDYGSPIPINMGDMGRDRMRTGSAVVAQVTRTIRAIPPLPTQAEC